jgi:hypothetical protein
MLCMTRFDDQFREIEVQPHTGPLTGGLWLRTKEIDAIKLSGSKSKTLLPASTTDIFFCSLLNKRPWEERKWISIHGPRWRFP